MEQVANIDIAVCIEALEQELAIDECFERIMMRVPALKVPAPARAARSVQPPPIPARARRAR